MKFDRVDGMMTYPPQDDIQLTEQVEYMSKFLRRPPLKGIEITIPLLKWQWSWLHMRYCNLTNSPNGKKIKAFQKRREQHYLKEYEDGTP
jgi:hypothetical protein